jgi:predicted aspartyl protease
MDILIDYGANHSYINANIVEIFHFQKSKHKKYWLVHLAMGAKRKINELVKYCSIDMNGLNTKVDVNIIPLGSYDCLIGMDWLEKHHVVLDYYKNKITCLDEEGKHEKIQGILRAVVVVGRLVVVIDVNPSHGFWTTRLMKLFGHEGKCTCRYNTHGWIVYIILFPVVCGTSHGSSWLRRNEFLKMTK